MSVELDDTGAAFGKQFKRADRSGAVWALVIGDQEVESGEIILRPLLAKGEERRVQLDDFAQIVAFLKAAT